MDRKDNERTLVVGIGELLWDLFPGERRPGGAPANVAWHAGQLGLHGVVVSRLGRDEAGRALRETLEARGLDLSYVQEDDTLPTGVVDVDASDPDAPEYTIRRPAAWDAVCFDEDLRALAREARAVCYGTLFQRDARSRESLHAFLHAAGSAFRLYDVNLRQDFHDPSWVEASLEAAHAVKVNEEEAARLARMLDAGPSAPHALARRLRDRYAVSITCITRGARGCVLVEEDEIVEAAGRPVAVADAVGAGDAFGAGFLAARLAGASLAATASFANAVAALVASRRGAMPSLVDEYASLRDEHLGSEMA